MQSCYLFNPNLNYYKSSSFLMNLTEVLIKISILLMFTWYYNRIFSGLSLLLIFTDLII